MELFGFPKFVTNAEQIYSNQWKMFWLKNNNIIFRYLLLLLPMTINGTYINAVRKLSDAQIYLSYFGYLPESAGSPNGTRFLDNKKLSLAIMDFQNLTGLSVTGDLNDETMELMSLPRCGVPDKDLTGLNHRSNQYALFGGRWNKTKLTFRITKYSNKIKKYKTNLEFGKAFFEWSQYIDFTITPKRKNSVDIEIRFETDKINDGPNYKLAYAFFSLHGGNIHFDDSKMWSKDHRNGISLFQMAVHEIGHLLGLGHSFVPTSMMSPFYSSSEPKFRLDFDDIQRIQLLYGIKNPFKRLDTELCSNSKIDAIFKNNREQILVFKEKNYYMLTEIGMSKGNSKLISNNWPQLPDNIDAACTTRATRKNYFFKGSQFWRYTGRKLDDGYPHTIIEDFPGIPNNVDAVICGYDNNMYFYKGTKFWTFNPILPNSTYSNPILSNNGYPRNIDAALYLNGYTYFFKGEDFFQFTHPTSSTNFDSPRSTAQWWLGCINQSFR